MVGGESDYIASICCKKLTMHVFHSPISRKTQSPSFLRRRKFQISLHDENEQTIESELEDSSGEYATAAERSNRDR